MTGLYVWMNAYRNLVFNGRRAAASKSASQVLSCCSGFSLSPVAFLVLGEIRIFPQKVVQGASTCTE